MRSRLRKLGLCWMCLQLLWSLVGTASAAADDASARSQKLFSAALDAKRAGDLPRALCLMQLAQAAWPHAAFTFNVAQLQRELGMCAKAEQNYRAFLANEREPSRRQQAERALAELAQCKPAPEREAAAESCSDWANEALTRAPPNALSPLNPNPTTPANPNPTTPANANANALSPAKTPNAEQPAQPSVVPTPSQLARSQPTAARDTGSLMAASHPARRMPAAVPWLLVGAGVVCAGLAGYELAELTSAERAIEQARRWDASLTRREQDGRNAQTLFWVFGGAGILALSGALVLALWDEQPSTPSAAINARTDRETRPQ